jgi:serine/threonine-protein kinase RsbW
VPTVELRFTAVPAHVRTARLVAVSLARRAGIDEEVLDEVRLAVGEAATRAVGRHRAACPSEPVLVRLTDGDGNFVAEVVDYAADAPEATDGTGAGAGADAEGSLVADIASLVTAGSGALDPLDDELPPGVDLAVISSLVDEVTVESGPAGSVVRMTWPVNESTPSAPSGFGGSRAPA